MTFPTGSSYGIDCCVSVPFFLCIHCRAVMERPAAGSYERSRVCDQNLKILFYNTRCIQRSLSFPRLVCVRAYSRTVSRDALCSVNRETQQHPRANICALQPTLF